MNSKNKFILGIDASNISTGGGLTHLTNLLHSLKPSHFGIDRIVIWSSKQTLSSIKNFPWLIKRSSPVLNKNFIYRAIWQKFQLQKVIKQENCNLLFVPGGSFVTSFRPVVTMSQNLLPFELTELKRYGLSLMTLRLLLLRFSQSRSFKKSNGIIFLTEFAQNRVMSQIGDVDAKLKIISHGIDQRFFADRREYLSYDKYTFDKPIKIIYVSSIDPYKHHLNVIDAISYLRNKGLPVLLELIGPANNKELISLNKKINKVDKNKSFIKYYGNVDYSTIDNYYFNADIAVFASSCETFGQILLEGMATGLPTACSDMSSMSEILGEAGIYFNPLDIDSIADRLKKLIKSDKLRKRNGLKSISIARKYSWDLCANETFQFLKQIKIENS